MFNNPFTISRDDDAGTLTVSFAKLGAAGTASASKDITITGFKSKAPIVADAIQGLAYDAINSFSFTGNKLPSEVTIPTKDEIKTKILTEIKKTSTISSLKTAHFNSFNRC